MQKFDKTDEIKKLIRQKKEKVWRIEIEEKGKTEERLGEEIIGKMEKL